MSQVFGTPRNPAYTVTRTDRFGRPISLDLRTPEGNSVLFTGPPGMGKTVELDRAQALAEQQGWIGIRVDASPREPLENRFVRRVTDDLGAIRKRYGMLGARRLKKLVKDLGQRNRSRQNGAELRVMPVPFVQGVAKTQWEAGNQDSVGSTLNELAGQLGELAANRKPPEPVLLMVDNLDVASERDLAALTELAAHLEQQRRPVFLIAAGGELAATRLMAASGGRSRVATGVTGRFDVREVGPLSDDELRPALTEPLRQAGIAYEPEAVARLVRSANGDPTRLRDLSETALPMALARGGVTVDVAKAATAQVNDKSRVLYQAAWNNCSDSEKELLAKVAAHGPQGLSLPGDTGLAGLGRWQELDDDRQQLVARGMLRDDGQRISVADQGLQEWVQARVGQSAAHLGIAPPTAATPAITAESARPTATRDYKGMTFQINS
ncbi:ATP-binding protein [Kribbella turkmenica]|uniref:ATP-binding protein n=1 Tax=Kribbella turkmenica TaxID=2530375 RepID=A0A4R4XGQ4_9ACTN|nr:AAA family ATPase [Kribbella turkmenica]TDD29934.1 ATP-binding protein [Kribbella turkmenica]